MHRQVCRLCLAVLLAGCSAATGPEAGRAPPGWDCVALFRQYDVTDATMSTPWRERWTVPPELERLAIWLRQGDCITLTGDLVGMGEVPVAPVEQGGTSIDPISVHVGVVTNSADDARAIAFFEERGLRARSIGKAGLGRRVYVGPVTSAAALEAVTDLAVEAGFRHPYPVRF